MSHHEFAMISGNKQVPLNDLVVAVDSGNSFGAHIVAELEVSKVQVNNATKKLKNLRSHIEIAVKDQGQGFPRFGGKFQQCV